MEINEAEVWVLYGWVGLERGWEGESDADMQLGLGWKPFWWVS